MYFRKYFFHKSEFKIETGNIFFYERSYFFKILSQRGLICIWRYFVIIDTDLRTHLGEIFISSS